ncbi:MAG: hypothetical protein KGI70_00915 [Patescibacteria group bacterium]|nr:hypothetical protein [Patescibacteria group bacterium]
MAFKLGGLLLYLGRPFSLLEKCSKREYNYCGWIMPLGRPILEGVMDQKQQSEVLGLIQRNLAAIKGHATAANVGELLTVCIMHSEELQIILHTSCYASIWLPVLEHFSKLPQTYQARVFEDTVCKILVKERWNSWILLDVARVLDLGDLAPLANLALAHHTALGPNGWVALAKAACMEAGVEPDPMLTRFYGGQTPLVQPGIDAPRARQ